MSGHFTGYRKAGDPSIYLTRKDFYLVAQWCPLCFDQRAMYRRSEIIAAAD